MVSVVWCYWCSSLAVLLVGSIFEPEWFAGHQIGAQASWSGAILIFTYLLQALLSAYLDKFAEEGLLGSLFYVIWYPLAFWVVQALTAAVGVPRGLLRQAGKRGIWLSPDRGVR